MVQTPPLAPSRATTPAPPVLNLVEKDVAAGPQRNASLECFECLEDPEVPYEKKKQTYDLVKFDQHLKGDCRSMKATSSISQES